MKSVLAIVGAALLAVGMLASSANAGSVSDGDSDLVPDAFDNCSAIANGPGEASNQVDTDSDGFGNACDCDFDQDNVCAGSDFGVLLGNFGTGALLTDMDGDGLTAGSDFGIFLGQFGGAPGPGAI